MAKLAVGDKAPAFTLKDQHGKLVRLSGFKGKRVVVYFYPKADTPGCTTAVVQPAGRVPAAEEAEGRGGRASAPTRSRSRRSSTTSTA